ncbi:MULTISPECIES: hypothetical protein [Photorhabdus]|uniref:t-SNARE coiled-coil homology domain-containing protein n=1 Tax=Photorhabdus kayaii TaxID=230088 RepID=A0ABX0AYL1_9GAMM|nr:MULTISPECIES: hypothetical protein [Photorhabdus]MCC8374468.1 hypothetical protein [Photorhabdus bodei]MCT8351469.1 hypothetical protein [Photorhabdus kayaii]MDB6366302.1 hypothetical protein [Photorhabdus bodei]NDL10908.1 hypothetical protein [Photorhabdus kayaii]NDL24373.1 hypothetical protein [Photorhabdus kayaii]
MSGSDDKKIEFNTSDVLNALLHRGQNMQHLATQENVDNLRRETEVNFASLDKRFESIDKQFELIDRRFESIDKRFDVMDKRIESIDKRFDKLEGKFDRLQWFIVAAALALLFKEYIFKAAAVIQ